MQFKKILRQQVSAHPSMEPRDVVKLCYQTVFGAEHLLDDLEAAEKYFMREYEQVQSGQEEPLYECIGEDIVRVNLGAWKNRMLPPEWLFRMFVETASRPSKGGKELFDTCLREASSLAAEGVFRFDWAAWEEFLREYPLTEPAAVHHSENYRKSEKPAYRLVHAGYMRMLPLLELIGEKERAQRRIPPGNGAVAIHGQCSAGNGAVTINSRCAAGNGVVTIDGGCSAGNCVVAIDGRCASGKTTLSGQLAKVTGGSVIHMDDFFLPKELRKEERLREPGGNVHYERFLEEVIPFLKTGEDFSYRCFECKKMEFGRKQKVQGSGIIVVEGAYSCHPKFGEYMTIKAFCDVEPEEQLRRVEARDGELYLDDFKRRWIPMEETYFAAYSVKEQADVVI